MLDKRRSLLNRCYAQIFLSFLAFGPLTIHSYVDASPVDACPHVSIHGREHGNISSPNYGSGRRYPNDMSCTWDIQMPKGFTLILTFKDFVTERDFACNNDYVKVFDGPNEKATMLGKYCGNMNPFKVEPTGNTLFIKFVSDSSLEFRGFWAEFKRKNKSLTSTPDPRLKSPTSAVKLTPKRITTERVTTRTTAATTKASPKTTVLITKPPPKKPDPIIPTVIPLVVLSFDNPLGNHTIAVGSSRKLVCHVKGTKMRVPIVWTRNGNQLKRDTEGINIRNMHRRKSVLELKKATKKDGGLYGCHAGARMRNIDSIHMYGFVNVKDPPVIKRGPESQKVFAGETVKLTCHVGGDPPLNIRWYINGVDSSRHATMDLGSTSTLAFRAVKRVQVECLVYNNLDRQSHKAWVGIQEVRYTAITGPKVAIVTMATLNQTADIGTNITLRCSARGTPPILIRWFIGGNYYDGDQVRSKDNIYTSYYKMTVKKAYTVVKCSAQNPYGIDNKSGVIQPKSEMEAVSRNPWNEFLPGKSMFYILIVCVLAVLSLVLLGVVCFRRQRANNRYKPPSPVSLEQLTKNPIFERNSNMYVNPKLERWELHRNNIEFVKDLEDGAFSRLFLGRMTHASRGEQDTLVMVKVRKETVPTAEIKDAFEEEAVVLTTYDHPNVQSLLGVCVQGRPLCLVLECTDRGDLNLFLRDCGCSHYIIRERPSSSMDPDSNKLSHLDQLCIAKQIAAGMEYLASKCYVHKQLSTKNCIISKNMVVKIANLGLTDTGPTTGYFHLGSIQKSKYPVRWLPLESINNGVFDDNTDIWSYGIVLWEVYSYGMTPYYGMNNDEVITLVREGDILPRPKECPREIYSLMQDCWSLVPHERPRFRFLHQKISALFTGVAV